MSLRTARARTPYANRDDYSVAGKTAFLLTYPHRTSIFLIQRNGKQLNWFFNNIAQIPCNQPMAKQPSHKTDPVPIGSVLTSVLKSCQSKTDGSLAVVWDLWTETVGDAIAQNAKPAAFKQDILLVHVSSSVWLHHLQFLKQDIITKLNAAMENASVKEIKFKIGTF